MKEIRLDSYRITTVSDEDYDLLSKYEWYYVGGYVLRKGDNVRIHRVIMGVTDPKIQVDHRNGNKLCNERWNLRIATTSQNQANRPKFNNKGTSEHKGVRKHKCGKWESRITQNRICFNLGLFTEEDDAAIAYNKKAIELFGEFAHLNIIEKE